MKKIIIGISTVLAVAIAIASFMFVGSKPVKAATGDIASYEMDPWTFYQTGTSTNDWNPWELCAYNKVEFPGTEIPDLNKFFFKHEKPGRELGHNDARQVTASGVAKSFIADIESNGWSGDYGTEVPTVGPVTDPPQFTTSAPATTTGEGGTTEEVTTKAPTLQGNNPYTLRCWTTINKLKKNRTYSFEFDAFINKGAYVSRRNMQTGEEWKEEVTVKYAKIVGTAPDGTVLFVRNMAIGIVKDHYVFNFDVDKTFNNVKIEMMFGAFLMTGSIIQHVETSWTGVVNIMNCEVYQGNMTTTPTPTTTRYSGGGFDWDDDYDDDIVSAKPAKVKGLTAKNTKKKSVLLTWKKASRANKYQVNYSLKKNFKPSKSKYTKKKKYIVTKLKKKKTYYFRVRGVKGSKKGKWSTKKKVKIKK